MTINELIVDLVDGGVVLDKKDDGILARIPKNLVLDNLSARLKNSKKDLLGIIGESPIFSETILQCQLPKSNTRTIVPSFKQVRRAANARIEKIDLTTENKQTAFEILGGIDTQLILSAFAELSKRHDALRIVFTNEKFQEQSLLNEPTVVSSQWWLYDHASFQEKAKELMFLPRPIGKPLWRVDLFSIQGSTDIALLTTDNTVFDDYSTLILLRELNGLLSYPGEKPEPISTSHQALSIWQRRWMLSSDYRKQLEACNKKLFDIEDIPAIRCDRVRPVTPKKIGKNIRSKLPEELIESAITFSQQHNTTLFNTLISIFALLQHRYTNEERIFLLTTVPNRHFKEFENVVGQFENLVVVTTKVEEKDSFIDFLERISQVTAHAFSHQGVPIEIISDKLYSEKGIRYEQLIQTVFSWQETPFSKLQEEKKSIKPFNLDNNLLSFDLHLIAEYDGQGVSLEWQYNSEIFEPNTINQLIRHYNNLLKLSLSKPRLNTDLLSILDKKEVKQLKIWGTNSKPYQNNASIVKLFQDCVSTYPDSTAIEQDNKSWTYKQLDQQSDLAASRIHLKNIKRGDLVGVVAGRSLQFVATILAILKVGAAYLPLDPSYPVDRLKMIVTDALPKLIVFESTLNINWLENYTGHRVCLSSLYRLEKNTSFSSIINTQVFQKIQPDAPAYVMYTSGSTGKPKGVVIPHRGVVRLVNNSSYAKLDASTAILQHSPLSFDASTFEIWGCLLNGGRLVLLPTDTVFFDAVKEKIVKSNVTTMFVTTDLFRITIEEDPNTFRGLRELLVGGDALQTTSMETFFKFCSPDSSLINIYGPTENTTFSCFYRTKTSDVSCSSVPIGRPIENTESCIVNNKGNLVPIGVPGELWVGGAGLAAGYLGQPELTSKSFVESMGVRWYKTGDYMCWRRDGMLEFLGRIDEQVKLRGYRIELGEIESLLSLHPAVSGCVVVLSKKCDGENQLVGYIVARSGFENTSSSEVQTWLSERLPSYMVPKVLVWLEKLPQSVTGKLDRKRLSNADFTDPLPDDSDEKDTVLSIQI